MNATEDGRSVLVAPLNWGLGHAARCIPVIRLLAERAVSVTIASDGEALCLLKEYFPQAPVVALPSYKIRYPYRNALLNAGRNLPRIVRAIRNEHRLIEDWCAVHRPDCIISDHRLGCRHKDIPSVLIAHQLHIPLGPDWFWKRLPSVQAPFINRFDQLWIPDVPARPLSGALSHPRSLSIPAHLVGYLSPLQPLETKKRYDWLALLSGPEPARTVFEQLLIKQLKGIPGHHALVRGKPGDVKPSTDVSRLDVLSFCRGEALSRLIASARHIVCRSGYSSLMDLVQIGRNALLVPTPGQVEQEYIARRVASRDGPFVVQCQDKLDLVSAGDVLDEKEIPEHGDSKHLLDAAVDACLLSH